MKIPIAHLILVVVACFSSHANSQESTPGFHTHDGFYLSMATGYGGGNFHQTNYSTGSTTGQLEMSGVISHSDIKVGGALWKNQLILSGDFIVIQMPSPKSKLDGVEIGKGEGGLRQGMLGLGVTYYFMPVNIFLSGTLGAGRVFFNTEHVGLLGGNVESEGAVGFQLKAGKEWWVSKNWGLGVSMFLLSQNAKRSDNRKSDAGFLGLMFNTTFN